jgi:hypothetical protein
LLLPLLITAFLLTLLLYYILLLHCAEAQLLELAISMA